MEGRKKYASTTSVGSQSPKNIASSPKKFVDPMTVTTRSSIQPHAFSQSVVNVRGSVLSSFLSQ